MINQRRKNKFRGREEIIKPSGEMIYATIYDLTQQDISFYKFFRNGENRMFPQGLSGATHEVIQFLVMEMRKDNLVFFDQEELQAKLGISIANAKKIKATLLEKDIIRKKTGSAYILNPVYAVIVNGDERVKIYEEYCKLPPPKAKTELAAERVYESLEKYGDERKKE